MAQPFEVKDEITIDAQPDDVWQAMTSGPHLDSWFIGHSEVEPRLGGVMRMDFGGGAVSESTITAWEPGRRFAYASAPGPDGSSMAFEFTIEARGGGQTTIRLVHSGFLAGDNWETEYEALKKGDPMYLHTLGEYVVHFRGRVAVKNIFALGPQVTDRDQMWSAVREALGLRGGVAIGTPVQATPHGLAPIDGVVDYVTGDFLGLRTNDGLIRMIHGHDGTVVAEHHIFTPAVAQQESTESWQAWLSEVLTFTRAV